VRARILSTEIPVLVIAYNRPDQIRGLIQSLRIAKPSKVWFAVDGPSANSQDGTLVQEVLEEIDKLDWECDVLLKYDGIHRGLRRSVEEAVSWAFEQTERLIILEDDTLPTKAFFKFMDQCLEDFAQDQTVGHVSGYNKVPAGALANPEDPFRKSRYPESFAWGTWKRAWRLYSSDLSHWKQLPISDISKFTVSSLAAHCWSINIRDAKDEVISTWAYRWTLSLWANNLSCVTPNVNLVSSTGAKFGTHTRTKPTWQEIPTSEIMDRSENHNVDLQIDDAADHWLEKTTMRATPLGLIRRYAESVGLRLLALQLKRL
jgi:hypothetical protein